MNRALPNRALTGRVRRASGPKQIPPRPEKREAVLDAMLDLVAEHGFHGAPMALVAEHAGVGTGTIYRHFENKDALISACYEQLAEELYLAVADGYPEDGSVRDRFFHIATTVIRHFVERPREFRFLQQFQESPYGAQRHRERLFGWGEPGLVRDLFEEGRAQKVVKDLSLPVLFALAIGPVMSLCRGLALGFVKVEEPLIVQTGEACWDAIKR